MDDTQVQPSAPAANPNQPITQDAASAGAQVAPTDSTQPATAAPSDTAATASQGAANASQGKTPDQQGQQPPQQGQQPAPGQPGQPAPAISSKPAPVAPTGVSPDNPDATHPAVQKAGLLHTVAQALSGGPRYTYSIDPNTGQTTKTQLPTSNKSILGAIALEALSGGLAGMAAGKGAGNQFKGGAAGLAEGQQIAAARQAKEQQQLQQQSADYARHAQVMETNMKMRANAMQLGRMSFDTNAEYGKQFAPLYDKLSAEHPEVIQQLANGSELPALLAQYHITKDSVIPTGKVVPVLDANGQQQHDSYNAPMWDQQYAIIDPSFKGDSFLSDQDKADAAKYHLQGFVDGDGKAVKLPQSMPMRLSTALNLKSTVASVDLAQQDLDNYYTRLNAKETGASTPIWKMFPDTDHMADFIEQHEGGGNATARNVRNNNPGNLVADASWHGAVDDKNLPKGQAPFRVYPNYEAGRQGLINQLQLDQSKMPNATPEQYFQKYDAGDAQTYATAARKAAGVDQPETQSAADQKYKPVDLAQAIKEDPTLVGALKKFQPLLSATQGNYAKAVGELGKDDPQAAGKISRLYGGNDTMIAADQQRTLSQAADLANQKGQEKLDLTSATKRQEEQGIISRNSDLIDALANGSKIDLSRIATMRAYDRETIVNEVMRRNPNYNPDGVRSAVDLYHEAMSGDRTNGGTFIGGIANANTALTHMGGALEAFDQLKGNKAFSDYTNKSIGWMDQHFGADPQWVRTKIALQTAVRDWQNQLNNQHALTDEDKEYAKGVLDPNAPVQNSFAAIKEMAKTSAARILPYDQRWYQAMGEHFPNMIEPQTIKAIRYINDPDTNEMMKDMQSGGSLQGGEHGTGKPGTPLSTLLNQPSDDGLKNRQTTGELKPPSQRGQVQQTFPGQKPGEVPVFDKDKNVIGFSTPGVQGWRKNPPPAAAGFNPNMKADF